ncbi:SDR family oxidoreductase [Sorangium sp. So ce295]|uniref:SDR family NAD(P)-dependent oxidoreductase n=1 Tax=Sorangium sp. So ce295 TaxID=3133295 RepID=UPI003F62445E
MARQRERLDGLELVKASPRRDEHRRPLGRLLFAVVPSAKDSQSLEPFQSLLHGVEITMLSNKVVLITGATSGIGAATAIAAARAGAKVVLAARRQEMGDALAARIKVEGGNALFVRTDVTVEADIHALIERTVEVHGRLDSVFNNAGIATALGPLADVPVADYLALMQVNLHSIYLCMRYQVPVMKKGGGGSIVNCGSIASTVSAPGFGVYAATKHAILGLTKSAAIDYAADKIRVNAILPGPVETEIWDHMQSGEQVLDAFGAATLMKRYAHADEIARPAVFLLSDWSSYMTGTQLTVDGGYTAV